MTSLVFGTVLPWLLVGVGVLLVLQLIRQNGRILLRLDTIEQRLIGRPGPPAAPPAQGLKIGTHAPDFELPDLKGGMHKLSEWRGRNVLLLFFNPGCGYCTRMAADLAAVPGDESPERPKLIVVTTGDAEANRALVKEHGIGCVVLLQNQMEVASKFRAHGTPMGYLIDASGRIASDLTIGAESLLSLAAGRTPDSQPDIAARRGRHKSQEPDPSLARSRLNRSGLNAGEVAPEFTLPQIDGNELSLTDLRGGRVLLVFSDPDCGPCDELAPQLQELHEERTDLQVVVISRRDTDETRAKAEQLGLTYPVVMQKQWELSLKYGMFATPIGYLIDEQGVLLSDVAVGVAPILQLAEIPEASLQSRDATSQTTGELIAVN
jgi:peroxiredoxin